MHFFTDFTKLKLRNMKVTAYSFDSLTECRPSNSLHLHSRKTVVACEKVRQPGSRRVYDGNSRGHVKNDVEARVNCNIRGETVVTCRVYIGGGRGDTR